jgi:hypothetical protein
LSGTEKNGSLVQISGLGQKKARPIRAGETLSLFFDYMQHGVGQQKSTAVKKSEWPPHAVKTQGQI